MVKSRMGTKSVILHSLSILLQWFDHQTEAIAPPPLWWWWEWRFAKWPQPHESSTPISARVWFVSSADTLASTPSLPHSPALPSLAAARLHTPPASSPFPRFDVATPHIALGSSPADWMSLTAPFAREASARRWRAGCRLLALSSHHGKREKRREQNTTPSSGIHFAAVLRWWSSRPIQMWGERLWREGTRVWRRETPPPSVSDSLLLPSPPSSSLLLALVIRADSKWKGRIGENTSSSSIPFETESCVVEESRFFSTWIASRSVSRSRSLCFAMQMR